MAKINLNSRNNHLAASGILNLIDSWVNQDVTTTSSPEFASLDLSGPLLVGGDLTVVGNVTIGGSTTVISTDIVEIKDNIVELNANELGPGVGGGTGSAGLEVNRGSLINYRMVFDEISDDFKIGLIGSLQSVATREDAPLNAGVMVYNNTLKRLDSTTSITLPINLTANETATTSANGTLRVTGGVGITGTLMNDNGVYFKSSGSNYNNGIKADTNNNLNIYSDNHVNFVQAVTKKVNLPANVFLTFDSGFGARQIYNDGTDFRIENNTGNITFNTLLNGDLNIRSGTFLRWNSTNSLRYDGTDFLLASTGAFRIAPNIILSNNTSSTSSGSGSFVTNGGIAINNTTDAVSSSNGGTFTSSGGGSFNRGLFVGDRISVGEVNSSKTPASGEGINFRSRNRTISTSTSVNTTFNSIEGGALNTSVVIPIASSLFVSGAPVASGSGSITNSYSFLVNSGRSLFNGSAIISDNTISSTSSSGALTLLGGIGINNATNSTNYLNGGCMTIGGGIGIGGDAYFGGKIDTSALNTNISQSANFGVNFRSRNRVLTTSNTVNTVFNSFDGGSLNTVLTIPSASTVYIAGDVSVSGGGSITNSYSLFVASGQSRFDGGLLLNSGNASTSTTTGALTMVGGIGISDSTDAVSINSGGSITSAGGAAFGKKLYTGLGLFTSAGTGIGNTNHLSLLTSNTNRFTIGLRNIETGSNTGSDFYINRSDDSGTSINNVLNINRASGLVSFLETASSTSSTTGSIVISGGIGINNGTDAASVANGGTITTGGGAAIGKKLYVGGSGNFLNDLNVDGVSNLDAVNIDTSDGVLSVSGTNGFNFNVGSASSLITTSGSITIDSNSGTLVLDGNSGVNIDSNSGISINSGASSNFSTSSGNLSLIGGNNTSVSATSGNVSVAGNTGINLTTGNTANGIKIGTTVSGVPITIGNTVSETIISDNLTVIGDLTVTGTTTSLESVLITVNDNAIVVNNMPSGTSDGGFIVRRYQTPNNSNSGDVVSDVIKEASTFGANSSGVDTITLNASSSSVTNYYKGWWIKVTSGAGSGQVRRILTYNGATKVASIYSNANNNPNNDGLDLTTPISSGDGYNLYDSPYAGMFFDESNNEWAVAGVAFDPSSGEFPSVTTYYPIHAQTVTVEQSIVSVGLATFEAGVLIDADMSDAFLIRKNNNSGKIFNINSLTGATTLSNPVSTLNSEVVLNFDQLNSVSINETYSTIKSVLTNNLSGDLTSSLVFSVQNDTGLANLLVLAGGVSPRITISEPTSITSSVSSSSSSSGALIISGGIGVNNGTDATSASNGGSLTLAGGAAIAKKLYVGGRCDISNNTEVGNSNTYTASSGSLNTNGDLVLYNSGSSKIAFNNAGVAAPSFTNRSSGTKIIFSGSIGASSCDYAIGNETNTQWYSVPTISQKHLFYTGITQQFKVDSGGISTLQPGTGIKLDNGSNYSSFMELNQTTRFKPHTTGVSAGLVFTDASDTLSRIRINSDGQLSLGLSNYYGPGSANGKLLNINSIIFTDTVTASNGTLPTNIFNNISQPTLAASELSVTTTDSINTYIGGAPIRGTNQTFTNAFNLYLDNAASLTSTGSIALAATVYIKGNPIATSPGTINNSYSLFIAAGDARLDGKLLLKNTSNTVPDTVNLLTDYGNVNTTGDIILQNSTRQGIYFNNAGSGVPSFTNRSAGSKIILRPGTSASSVDNAIGVSSTNNWYSVPTSSSTHDFYTGTNMVASLSNTGITLNSASNTLIKPSTSDGADDKGIIILGGGASGTGRGAQVEVYGNETNSGNIVISSGISGQINYNTAGVNRLTILNNGEVSLTSTSDTTGTGTGSFRTPGGLNVDKSVYIGQELNLAFNQRYSYTGDVSGRLNVTSKTSGINNIVRHFTNDGDNTDNNLLQIYGLGTTTSLINTEFLQLGYGGSNNYNISTQVSGSGALRNLTLNTGNNNGQLVLNSDGSVSSVSQIIYSNTTNSTSATNGGALTINGGAAIAKDLYVGGTLSVVGGISNGMTTPTVTIANENNITGSVSIVRSRNYANGIYRTYSVGFVFTPTVSNATTTFTFTLPEIVSNFANTYDIIANVNGYHGAVPEVLENSTAFAIIGSTSVKVSTTSGGTGTHILQIMVNYNV